MDKKDTHVTAIRSDILLYNEEYFKYIFKKTEKIVSAVFYTTRSLNSETQKDSLVRLVEDKSIAVMELAQKSLTLSTSARIRVLEELRAALSALESVLVVLTAARLMREDIVRVFQHELAMLQRSMRDYMHETGNPFDATEQSRPLFRERTQDKERVSRERVVRIPGVALLPQTEHTRRSRILGIIKDRGEVTIKDVSALITDCSEKTIQRELMSLISEGVITKEGERRWSRYSLAKP